MTAFRQIHGLESPFHLLILSYNTNDIKKYLKEVSVSSNMEDKEVPVGCKPVLSKLNTDLREDADGAVIQRDLEMYRHCLKANNGDKKD